MLELNEDPMDSAKRELMEEAFESYKFDSEFLQMTGNPLTELFNKGVEV